MKKLWQSNNYFRISLYAIFVISVSILFYRISSNSDNIVPSIMTYFKNITNVLSPIIYGLLVSYLLNPIMDFFERNLLKLIRPKTQSQKKKIRTLSIIIVYICIFGSVIWMIRYLLPQILVNIRDLINMLPLYISEFKNMLTDLELTVNENISALPYHMDTTKLFDMFSPEKYFDLAGLNSIMTTIVSQAFSITSSLFNWIMGFVISFYALEQKESFVYGAKRLTYSFLSESTASKIIAIFKEGHEIFIRFFVGKFIDSFIIGVICFIGLSIIKNPYALLLSVIVGVFNMIPYFGPILGAIPAVLITLFEGFLPAVSVAGFIFLLQQFDGLVLGPKILGDSIGLSPFWIISGILVGGALWGPLGMFFASPLIAIILITINRWVDKTLLTKNIYVLPLSIDHSKSPPNTPANRPRKKRSSQNGSSSGDKPSDS
ncbi:AI-2E family transporter [Cellulosilyticum sp. I15G10I2]|uniref:AI-2E family transporter n=1 Tax=Cellulosilyticum sp. I15G10I2 TaxID=1892843 RepID=UPI00085BF724|nr:AI-2E family transporter [Cellulosilyticum sp. I15G10I2]